MTLQELCLAGEAKLQGVSDALLDPRPGVLDRCEADLQEVIGMLQSQPADASARTELMRLRRRIRLLALQVQQSMNLCQGWAQLTVSEGYTDQGRPVLLLNEPRSSYEA